MKKNISPVELLLVALIALAWAAATIARFALVPLVALVLTLAGWRPCSTPAPHPAPITTAVILEPVPAAPAAPLASLTVAELRRRARAADHRALARSGRRAELLAVLG